MALDPESSGAVHERGMVVPVDVAAVSPAGGPGATGGAVAAAFLTEGSLLISALMARTR